MFTNVLLPVDPNHHGSWERALPMAAKLAGKKGKLHVLGIVHDLGSALVADYLPKDFEKKALKKMKKDLDAFVDEHMPSGVKTEVHVGHGHVPEHILTAADEVEADIIVMASHPHDLQTILVGSNADKVVRHATRPVLVVR